MVLSGPVWSHKVQYGPVYCIVPFSPIWSLMVPYGQLWPCMVLYGFLGPLLSWMVLDGMHGPLWFSMVPYGYQNFKMVLCQGGCSAFYRDLSKYLTPNSPIKNAKLNHISQGGAVQNLISWVKVFPSWTLKSCFSKCQMKDGKFNSFLELSFPF